MRFPLAIPSPDTGTTSGSGQRPSTKPRSHQRFVKLGVIALLLFGPLAFGAVEPWAILTLQLSAACLLVIWTLGELLTGANKPSSHPLYLPSGLFLLVIIGQFALHQTVGRQQTLESLLLYVALATITFLAIQSFRSETDFRQLMITLAIFGFVLGVLGCVQDFTSGGKLYWLRTPSNGGAIYGPYVNKNHFAGIMELLLPFPLAAALNQKLARDQRFMLIFIVVVMGVTVFLCGSRGGMVALSAEVLFFSVVLIGRDRKLGPSVAVSLLLLAMLAGALTVSGDLVMGKMATFKDREEAGGRLQVSKDTLQMFKARPLAGWGLGTFPAAYPAFRTTPSMYYLNAAHDDYLQFLAETGVAGMSLIVAFIVLVYRGGIRNYKRRREGSWSSTLVLACLTSFTAILVHSFFDFNLQIPANALLFFVCGALACACAPSIKMQQGPLQFSTMNTTDLAVLR